MNNLHYIRKSCVNAVAIRTTVCRFCTIFIYHMITPDKGYIELMLPIILVFMCHEKYFGLQLDASYMLWRRIMRL